MRSFNEFIENTENDPALNSYFNRNRVTPQSREDLKTIMVVIELAMSTQMGRQALYSSLKRLGSRLANVTPEIQDKVQSLQMFTTQDARDAAKLYTPSIPETSEEL